jgi:phospholipid transport system substrate-binding protein
MKKDYHQEKTTQVYATVEDPGKNPIAVIYQMRRFDNEWKVFDVIVEGISMLKGLQAQYEQIIATEGLPGAINRMKEQL